LLLSSCTYQSPPIDLDGQDVSLTFLHTSDWHSRLLPYEMEVGAVDERLGLLPENAPFGGAARAAWILRRERARSERVLHVDSGDCFQGAPIFNLYSGEAEMRTFAAVGLDAMVIGNHEFDRGAANFALQAGRFATYPTLAANYVVDPPDPLDPGPTLSDVVVPYVVRNVKGLRVAMIGMGNLSSLTSLYESSNRLGLTPLETTEIAQAWIDLVRPLADLVVVVSHMGLRADEEMIRETTGIDLVFGGHLHIVLAPPKVVEDAAGRPVVLVHSGAFMKYVGRLDVVVRQSPGDPTDWDVASHRYALLPVDRAVPEDAEVAELLEPYAFGLDQATDLSEVIGYAPDVVRRFGAGGDDSALGNLVAESMWLRPGIQTDFALTNTSGLRADLGPGPVTAEEMVNVFPFDNTISTMLLSGREVQDLFDFVSDRSAGRGCQAQAQVAGVALTIDCGCDSGDADTPDCATVAFDRGRDEAGERILEALDPIASYTLATSDYLAGGGSGYRVLERNTTQQNTFIPMREAAIDRIRGADPCAAEDLPACIADLSELWAQGCAEVLEPLDREACVADAAALAEESCPSLPCIDARIGAAADGRIEVVLP